LEKSKVVFHEQTHQYTYDGKNVPSVSRILLEEGFINTTFFTEEGRNRGTAAHKAIAVYCRGAHCFRDPSLEPYLQAFKNFEKDCDWENGIIEEPMGCPQYCGTPDNIGLFQGVRTVLDVKTGGISAATGLQLAAYEKLYRITTEEKLYRQAPVRKIIKRYSLQVMDTGRYMLTEYKEPTDGYIWDSAVALWWWKKNKNITKSLTKWE
jgi:hypothetical protein